MSSTSSASTKKFVLSTNPKGDIFGGLTAGVVALPLALAFGAVSGAGPMAGLWGAIIVGFFAAIFGGAPSQISGPTGPMAIVVAGVFISLGGDPSLIFAAVILSGIIQIGFGFFRVGEYIRLVPYPVISGFMSGMGMIIIIIQLSQMFGHAAGSGKVHEVLLFLPQALSAPNWSAVLLSSICLFIVFAWPKKLNVYVPAPLAALVIGTVMSYLVPGAPTIGSIPSGLPEFVMPSLSMETASVVLQAAVILALLSSIESILAALVADSSLGSRHDSNRELFGQGIGNIIAGCFGAIPGTGATMRTVVNIQAGGRGRLSGVTHSCFLLFVVLVMGPLASKIPYAVLAAILTKVGYDIIDRNYIKCAISGPRWDMALMLIVLLLTVFVNLVTAVVFGVFLASIVLVKDVADAQIKELKNRAPKQLSDEEEKIIDSGHGAISLVEFDGPMSFGAAADFGFHMRNRIEGADRIIILDFTQVSKIDLSAARAIEALAGNAHSVNKKLYIVGMNDSVRETLKSLRAFSSLEADTFLDDRLEALRLAELAISVEDNVSNHPSGINAMPINVSD